MNNSVSLVWKGRSGATIPTSAEKPDEIVPFAVGLSIKQQKQVIQAFNNQAYDMGAEYIWKRSMVRLRTALSGLGMNFIGELLGREDIDEFSPIESVITDYNTIILAERLGVIGSTGSLKLKHALEIINHFFSINKFDREEDDDKQEDNELSFIDAFSILNTCVKYVLGEYDVSVAIEFSEFRSKLLRGAITTIDEQVQQIIAAPPFYKSTVISILLTAIRDEKGAKQEHALANLNALISSLWSGLPEKDKWAIGSSYRDVIAAGNTVIANGIRSALLKVAGFDYVPENLRSSTFIRYANQLVDVHFSYDNFANEITPTRNLANLGSVIPPAAFVDCIQAYLCVYLGNQWGHSFEAAPIAESELISISKERWEYYFNKVLQTDSIILYKLTEDKSLEQFSKLIEKANLKTLAVDSSKTSRLYKALLTGKTTTVKGQANTLYKALVNS